MTHLLCFEETFARRRVVLGEGAGTSRIFPHRHLLVIRVPDYILDGCCRPDGRGLKSPRKVRAPQGTLPGNAWARQSASTESATESKPPMTQFTGDRQG